MASSWWQNRSPAASASSTTDIARRRSRRRHLMGRLVMFSKIKFACAVMIIAAGLAPAAAQEIVFPASLDPVPGPMPDILQRYTPVTAERLKKPEDANWLLFRRTYDGWGYSPLEEITRANVSRLQPVWSFATGQVEGHQAPPIVNNGVMFVATPGNQLLAMEAKSGKVLWG